MEIGELLKLAGTLIQYMLHNLKEKIDIICDEMKYFKKQ